MPVKIGTQSSGRRLPLAQAPRNEALKRVLDSGGAKAYTWQESRRAVPAHNKVDTNIVQLQSYVKKIEARLARLETRDFDLHGRRTINAADALKAQDYVTLAQLNSTIQSLPQIPPDPYKNFIAVSSSGLNILVGNLLINSVKVLGQQGAAVATVSGVAGGTYTATEQGMLNNLVIAVDALISRLQDHGIILWEASANVTKVSLGVLNY